MKIEKEGTGFVPMGKLPKLPTHNLRATAITSAMANFIAEDLRPVSLVGSSGFQKFMGVVEHNI